MLSVLPKRSFLLKVLKDRAFWPHRRGLSDSIKCPKKQGEHTYTERLNYSLEYKHPHMTYLMYYYLHMYEFWIKLSFCSRVHLCEIWKVFPIMYQRVTTLTHLTPLEKQELYDGFYQMIRSVPFILAVVIPFGEALAPIILIHYPNVFPRSFSSIFKSDINSFLVLLQKMIKYWDSMITESLLTSHDVTLFHRLSSKQIKMKILELKKRLTIKDLGQIISRFQAEYFFKYSSLRALRFTAREMGIPLVDSRPHLVHNILIKLHRIKAEDNHVFHEQLIETLSYEQLQKMCIDRGINCLGNTRSRMVKRLNRWFEFSVKMQVELVFLYLTRVSHYDMNDLLSEVVNNPACDIVNGIKMVFETDPMVDLDATYKYSVGIMTLLLSNYSTGFKV